MSKNPVIITKNYFTSRVYVVNRRLALRKILVLVFIVIFLMLLTSAIHKLNTRKIKHTESPVVSRDTIKDTNHSDTQKNAEKTNEQLPRKITKVEAFTNTNEITCKNLSGNALRDMKPSGMRENNEKLHGQSPIKIFEGKASTAGKNIRALREKELEGWEMRVNRNVTNYVHPTRDTSFSLVDRNICSKMKPLVVIIVCSDIRNTKLRKAIRRTWAKNAPKYNILVLFLVGISPNEETNRITLKESIKYKDIITDEVIDTYNNLTIKSIFMLKWIHKRCMEAHFLMKADDDSYINLSKLHNFTLQVKEDRRKYFLVGFTQVNPNPIRNYSYKWYIPRYMYPENKYPTYVQGAGYLMSTYVAEKLYFQSLLNDIVYLEDLFITGICAKQINITAVDNRLFHFHYKPLSVPCNSPQAQLIAVGHRMDVNLMSRINRQLSTCSK